MNRFSLEAVPIVGRKAFAFIADTVPRDAVILVEEDYSPSAWEKAVKIAAALHPKKLGQSKKYCAYFAARYGPKMGSKNGLAEP